MSTERVLRLSVTLPKGVSVRMKTLERSKVLRSMAGPSPFPLDLGGFINEASENSIKSSEPITLTLELDATQLPELVAVLQVWTKEAEAAKG
jgi:hypothetical protein